MNGRGLTSFDQFTYWRYLIFPTPVCVQGHIFTSVFPQVRYLQLCACKDIFSHMFTSAFPQERYLQQCLRKNIHIFLHLFLPRGGINTSARARTFFIYFSAEAVSTQMLVQGHIFTCFFFSPGRYLVPVLMQRHIFTFVLSQGRYLHQCSCKEIFLQGSLRVGIYTNALARAYFYISFPQGRYLNNCSCKNIFLHLFSPGAVSAPLLLQGHMFTYVFRRAVSSTPVLVQRHILHLFYPRGGSFTSARARIYF